MSDRPENLAPPASLPSSPLESRSASGESLRFGQIQRRQLSIMFVDLAGSTEFTSRFELEDVRDLLLGFLEASAVRIEAAHGYVARFMGDGLLAYFGYPVAHAEAAALAVDAALQVQQAISQLHLLDQSPLQARIGIATGEVMIGDIVGRGLAAECMVVGEAANLAARLQAAARPGAILICDATRELLGEAYALNPTEPLALKGYAEQISAWQVEGSHATDRFQNRMRLGLAPLVGRDSELESLVTWLQNAGTDLQGITIIGEPGIGKSRLLHALRERAIAQGVRWLATSASASATEMPFFGLRRLIDRMMAGDAGIETARSMQRRAAAARWLGISPADARALTAVIGLSSNLPIAERESSLADAHARIPAVCAQFLRHAAQRGPIAVAIEDAHWLDGSSRQLLIDLLPQIADLPILLVATSRNREDRPVPAWPVLALAPLDQAAVAAVVRHATGGVLEDALLADVLRRSQGVALFAEELSRLLVRDQGARSGNIPESLADLLLSRVDRASNGLVIAQAIAVLGEDAFPSVIAALTRLERATVERGIDSLSTDGVLLQAADPARPIGFRHALFGESAYAAMPGKQRGSIHRAAARLLIEEQAPDSRIARHFDLGQDAERAIQWWQKAAHTARRQRALPEARKAYERVLVLTAQIVSATPDQQARELLLQSRYFEVLQLSLGYSAAETIAAGARLRELVEQQGDLQQQLTAVTGEWAAASSAGEYDLANRHAARAPAIAQALGTPDALAAAAMIQLTARYRCGDLLGAEDAFAQGEPYFFDSQFYRRAGAIAQTFGNAAINAWLVGNDQAARARLAVLVESETRLTDPYSQAFAKHMASMALLALDDLPSAEQAARGSLAIAKQAGFPQYEAIARITLGGALCGQGVPEDGLALMRDGLTRMETTRSRAAITLYHAWLGRAELLAGDQALALGTVERGLQICPQERFAIPELLRLRAVIEAGNGRAVLAQQILDDGRTKAMAMGARGWLRVLSATQLCSRADASDGRQTA